MMAEGAGNERPALLLSWIRIVAEAPEAAVDPVHKRCLPAHDADRQAASDNFAVGYKIGLDAEPRLRASGMHAKACNHLVENERGT
ncbi:hypothetical protein Elgi_47400 [Paenibacillus elgii]|nr:hypothetical protein Elgi_47400 [Paenibacillus elgii]